MATRASNRQAAQKAKKAITASTDGNSTGSKRKAASEKTNQPKKKKEDSKTEDSKTEESKTEDSRPEPKNESPDRNSDLVIDAPKEERPDVKSEEAPSHPPTSASQEPQPGPAPPTELGVKMSEEREDVVPFNILEKGIIYFFFRPRVNVEDPHSMDEVARSFAVLRPTPLGAELDKGQGPLDKDAKCRVIMLPKKKFPTSHTERDMAFVEKAGQSMKDLQENFIASTTYQTKTKGERTTQEAKPYAEGVYAITSTTRASHLAYIITLPKELGEIQENFGLHERGSWIAQSKNPKFPGPPVGQLPKDPEYPEPVKEKFGDLRWVPLEPEFINYPNAQILLIGEAQDSLGKAGVAEGKKEPHEQEPGQELEKLEQENESRTQALKGDETIFQDLGIFAKSYPQLPTTWDT
ncbi:hypothetical protein N7468_009546 [Penicillium chermesinum]|uniref:BTB domain transcription factor n=1 Tax=Penicillium chermesinum TaxID=63820 RepID=A0A9W9NI56_9EURO|nr:uncharacterized protein N7468_009546 [Penicillium chermesinum]KAJ5220342.1 hypothetical protein N7468_009546 [Penicillium chermesinum]